MLRRRPHSQAFFQSLDDSTSYRLINRAPEIVFISDSNEEELIEEMPVKQHKDRLNKTATSHLSKYQKSLQKLELTLKELYGKNEQQDLFFSGFGVYRQVVRLMANQKHGLSEQILIDILDGTRLIIHGKKNHPTGSTGYRNEITNYFKLAKKVSMSSIGKALFNFMLCLIGAAIIAASGILTFASFGILTPINAVGFLFGTGIFASVAVSGALGTLGLGTVIGSSMMLFQSFQKGTLSKEMHLAGMTASKSFF